MRPPFSSAILIPVFWALGCIEIAPFIGADADLDAQTDGPDGLETDACLPDCAGRQCGPDGCGGECGTCPDDRGCLDVTGLCLTPCVDVDGDGYGTSDLCRGPDCDDTSPTCNVDCGTDNDHDGQPDCDDGCVDQDGDKYGDGPDCEGSDCDDTQREIKPGAAEIWDELDNDCDGLTDCLDSDLEHYPCRGGQGACEAGECLAFLYPLPQQGKWIPAISEPVAAPEGCGTPELPCNPSGPMFNWPLDTGQTNCYDNEGILIQPCPGVASEPDCATTPVCGQDAQYCQDLTAPTRDVNRFNVSGTVPEETVLDNWTGRLWQKELGENKDWQHAVTACEELVYAGRYDWRLPDLFELQSLVQYGRTDPASDFPGMPANWFWSSSSFVGDNSNAWTVDFSNGVVSPYANKSQSHAIRCVAIETPEIATQRFYWSDGSNAAEPVAYDTRTGLLWQGELPPDGPNLDWQEALAHCEGLVYGSRDNWRLPNVLELASLFDPARHRPVFGPLVYPDTVYSGYWSSSSYVGFPSGAWYIYFQDLYMGNVELNSKANDHLVRCVASIQNNMTCSSMP